jgi:hypothetical protein
MDYQTFERSVARASGKVFSPCSGQRKVWRIIGRHGVARERGEHDVLLPSGQRAAFEVIEAELIFQLVILLLDRPALIRQTRERRQRRGGWQSDNVPSCAGSRVNRARRAPTLRGRVVDVASRLRGSRAPRHKSCAPRGVRPVAPTDTSPSPGEQRGDEGCDDHRLFAGRQHRRVRSRTVAMTGAGRFRRGVAETTFRSDETPVHRATSLHGSVRRRVALSPNRHPRGRPVS